MTSQESVSRNQSSEQNSSPSYALARKPPTNLAAVVIYEREAVPLDDMRELRSREGAIAQPVRELTVPDAVVSAQPLARRLRKVRNNVPVREVEDPRLGLGVELNLPVNVGIPDTNITTKLS